MTTITYARPAAVQVRCWLCGGTEGPLRSDVHMATGHLCPPCWTAHPRGRNRWSRGSSVLEVRLGLGPEWTRSGLRQAWVQQAAERHGILAWCDVPRGTDPPADPFGHLDPGAVGAAAIDLVELEAEHQRSLVPPERRGDQS